MTLDDALSLSRSIVQKYPDDPLKPSVQLATWLRDTFGDGAAECGWPDPEVIVDASGAEYLAIFGHAVVVPMSEMTGMLAQIVRAIENHRANPSKPEAEE